MNVLLVDDQKAIVDSLKNGIRWENLPVEQVYTACSAKEAKLVLMNFAVDVLISDIEMPEEDGISLCQWAKKKFHSLECIFLTSHADFEYAKKALRYGAEEYLLKPIDEQELRECIGKFEQLKQQVQEHKIYVSEDGLAKYIKKNIFSDTFVKDFVNQNMFRKIFNVFQVMICRFEKNDEP